MNFRKFMLSTRDNHLYIEEVPFTVNFRDAEITGVCCCCFFFPFILVGLFFFPKVCGDHEPALSYW